MFCHTCGKELNDNDTFCPHCGSAVTTNPKPVDTTHATPTYMPQTPNVPPVVRKINVLCLVGFILSLVSLFISLYCTIPIAAFILSIVGVVQASKRGDSLRGLGIAGIVISGISVVLFVILLIEGLSLLGI